ncbi:HdeA family protein [Microbulbifer yueqingensis]|uniref:HdeA/HdeB family protein n=1 Tax=Microbulbifer yueqingensis TaxID=658219 RepID=A0A1G9AP52_9GAMM|nr:HdeA family protein [Microbulbifer yueqingensis]SDK28335.1 HdeA/HdeB family protein [Microbulbifer yueqingensis]
MKTRRILLPLIIAGLAAPTALAQDELPNVEDRRPATQDQATTPPASPPDRQPAVQDQTATQDQSATPPGAPPEQQSTRKSRKAAKDWTCADFIAVDEKYQPKVVYWATANTEDGDPEAAILDIEATEKVVPMVITACKKTPKESFRKKFKEERQKVDREMKRDMKKMEDRHKAMEERKKMMKEEKKETRDQM